MAPELIREKARSEGLMFYFTGKKCRNDHIDQRYVASGQCVACVKLAASGAFTRLQVPVQHVEYLRAVLGLAQGVSPAQIARCQTDADHNLWIDGLWIGRWNTRAEVVLQMWDWLIEQSEATR